MTTLIINSSVQQQESVTRQLVDYLTGQLRQQQQLFGGVINRDLSGQGMEFLSADHVNSFYTAPDQRSEQQRAVIACSDTLIDELKQSRQLIIGAPMYNFSVPAVLKAWVDLICRVGETFRYTEQGPQGLLDIDRAYFVIASGGPSLGGPVDFSSNYLRQIAQFIGVKESFIIGVGDSATDRDRALQQGKQQIDQLVAPQQVNSRLETVDYA